MPSLRELSEIADRDDRIAALEKRAELQQRLLDTALADLHTERARGKPARSQASHSPDF